MRSEEARTLDPKTLNGSLKTVRPYNTLHPSIGKPEAIKALNIALLSSILFS